MPTGNLPASGKKLWEEVYDKALKSSCKGDKECAAGSAWKAVKNAGWKKDEEGNWHKKSDFQTFSLTITRASYDKVTSTMRWKASASDTNDDLYGDNMTLELFEDFIGRIGWGEPAPEEFRSQFWGGGMPYLSVSHYPDLDGKAVPGTIDSVFIDGNFLKSEGTFSDTPLGRACFKAVNNDLYGENKDGENKVRISIAFIDWKHRHKDTNFIFERKSLDDVCPECLQNMIAGVLEGKLPHPTLQGKMEFLKGQLIHEAMTRVPVNTRTLMEVERATMTTRKDDAESIIGEELAEELEEKAKLVGKSQALVIKADETMDCAEGESDEDCRKRQLAGKIEEAEPGMELAPAKADYKEEEDKEEDEEDEEEKKKKSPPSETEKSYVGEVAVVDSVPQWKPYGGATSMADAQSIIEAKKEQYRIEDLWWMFQDVTNNIMSDTMIEDKGKAVASAASEFKTMLGKETSKAMTNLLTVLSLAENPEPAHPLDGAFAQLKSQFDVQIASGASEDEVLRVLQEPYSAIAETIKSAIAPTTEQEVQQTPANDAVVQAIQQLSQQVSLLSARMDGMSKPEPIVNAPIVPERRSISPQLVMQKSQVATVKSATPKLRDIIARTTQ